MTEAERAKAGLPKLLNRDSSDVLATKKADGTHIYHLKGGFQCATMIKRNADGTFTRTCVDNMEAAHAFRKKSPAREAANVR